MAASRARLLDRWLLSRIARGLGDAPLRVVLWDGTEAHAGRTPPIGGLILKDRRTLIAVARDPDFHLGESYMRGTLEVEGDLVAVGEAIDRATEPRTRRWWRVDLGTHGFRRSRDNVHRHYDLGNDFYRLWLDREMLYTCAYFADPCVGLEEAQVAKMDHVCRKLALRPGERVVEAGCGWGALALHMARSCGVTVKAYNISHAQIDHARRRATEEGLADRVEFVEDDYRRIEGRFDAFVSVGMLEHVGLENYSALGGVIGRCLERHGRGLLHFIGRNRPAPLNAWIRKRIFPGAYPPSLAEALGRILEPRGFSVLDVENLRLHYARTLEHWRRRFEAAGTRIEASFGPRFTRAWRIYLAGSEAAFRAGTLQLFQVTFARGRTNAVPWRRAGLDVADAPGGDPWSPATR
jgi:cyclopropane-fatty-acyl-phospholipid synthase